MSNFEGLQEAVIEWANNRDLLKPENANRQFLKVVEELGELASSIAKEKRGETVDAMGDLFVTLIILSEQLDLDPVKCLQVAYAEIRGRNGKTVNGVFLKQSDYEQR
jgi:NTP pyrophosphatase (non-canonical NTP hydrolase)